MKIVKDKIQVEDLKRMARETFGDMVKAVVDVEKGVMAIGGELHSDEETLLIGEGSHQKDLWGINLYPAEYPSEKWVEFDSIINFKPLDGNESRGVDNPETRDKIIEIVRNLTF
mgnify:CR=1 FL=1